MNPLNDDVNRRTFVSTMSKVVGTGLLLPTGVFDVAHPAQNRSWTVGEIMDLFIQEVPGGPFGQTVDTLKAGDRDIKVTGIVTTTFATLEVIQKAISAKANFIIVHEPTFYNHLDETAWLTDDAVYNFKADLLKKHNIAVWRNHDYIHRLKADGVMAGVINQLGWSSFAHREKRGIFVMPPVTLRQLINQAKDKLNIPTVRYIGDLTGVCRRILLMPGAAGGRNQITAISSEKPDVVLCGEIAEWETAEYVRDARAKGENLSLVVLGHVASEEPGSAFLASWLKEKLHGVPVTHVPSGNSLMFL